MLAETDNDTRWLLENASSQNTSLEGSVNQSPSDQLAAGLIGFLLCILITVTLFGNIFVLSAILMYRNLRNVTNYFMGSLSVADLCVAIFVMLPGMLNVVFGRWVLGSQACYVFVTMDIMCSTSSIANLSMIAFDRYLYVTRPFSYNRFKKPMKIAMIGVWVGSFFISVIPVLLGIAQEVPIFTQEKCIFVPNKFYAVIASLVAFYIPLFFTIFAYYKIFKIAKKQAKKITEVEILSDKLKRHFNVGKETKAARTLGIVLICFIACWLPFFLMNIINPFMASPVSALPVTIIAWIGWANSAINPVVYSTLNKSFHNAFKKMTAFRRRSSQLSSDFKTLSSRKTSGTSLSIRNTKRITGKMPDEKQKARPGPTSIM